MSLSQAADIRRQVAEILKPPSRMAVSDCAERYMYLNTPGGYKGYFKKSITPYMTKPMDVLTSREHQSCIFVAPAQCGKTESLINGFVVYGVVADPCDMMIVQTSQATARDFVRRRIDRLHRHSEDLGSRLTGLRKDDNTHDKHYKAGNILSVGWPSINELSGKPIPWMLITDYDRMPEDVDHEGSAYDLAVNRTKTFYSRAMTVCESSPGSLVLDRKWKPSTPHEAPPARGILALYNRGDRQRWYVPCIHCGMYFEFHRQHLVFEPDDVDLVAAAESTQLLCPHCQQKIDHSHKKELNRNGKWLKDHQTIAKCGTIAGEGIRSNIASFWLNGAAAAFQTWENLILKELQAEQEYELTGNEQPLKTTINTDQGMPYTPKQTGEERTPEELQERKEQLAKKVIPEEVRFLFACVDVQANRFVVQVHGVGPAKGDTPGLECWIVDRFNLRLSNRCDKETGEVHKCDPAGYLEDWDLLINHVIEKRYPMAADKEKEMGIAAVACDSAGKLGVTDNAYQFWMKLKSKRMHKNFHLVKGKGGRWDGRVKLTHPDSSRRKDRKANAFGMIPVYQLNSNILKDTVDKDLKRAEPGPGYIHFPDWLGDWFFKELTAEEKLPNGIWQPIKEKAPNEAFDLLYYFKALLIIIKAELIDWNRPKDIAKPFDNNPYVFKAGDGASTYKPKQYKPRPVIKSNNPYLQ